LTKVETLTVSERPDRRYRAEFDEGKGGELFADFCVCMGAARE
jgi:hypothetical protein